MPEPIKLYMGKTIADLNKLSEYNYEPGRSVKTHITHSDKVFAAATTAKTKLDEERAYVLFMRYTDIVQKVRRSKEFKKENKHFSLLLGSKKLIDAIGEAETLSSSLRERYELLDATKAAEKIEKTRTNSEINNTNLLNKKKTAEQTTQPEDEKPVLPVKSLTCRELYDMMFSKNSDSNFKVLIMDIRSHEDFEESTIKHNKCINVPQSHIKPGTVSRNIEQGIWDTTHVNQWLDRGSVDLIVILDWKCTVPCMDDMADPVRSLTDALYKWEQNIFLKRSPVILDGGYCEWLEFYPQFTTNAKVLRPQEDKKPDTSVNSLLNFTFGGSKKDEAEEKVPEEDDNEQGQEPVFEESTWSTPVENGVTEPPATNAQLPSSRKPSLSNETLPSSGLYPIVPADINLKTSTNHTTVNGNTSTVSTVRSKQIPTVNRFTKPVMPSRGLKPKPADSSSGKPADSLDWPPTDFSSTDKPDSVKKPQPNYEIDLHSTYLEELNKMKKQKEENERITHEIERKRRETEMEQELERMKKEMEESERIKREAEKNFADLQRQKTKPKPESKSSDTVVNPPVVVTNTAPAVTSQLTTVTTKPVVKTTQPSIVTSQSKPDVSRMSKPNTNVAKSSVTTTIDVTDVKPELDGQKQQTTTLPAPSSVSKASIAPTQPSTIKASNTPSSAVTQDTNSVDNSSHKTILKPAVETKPSATVPAHKTLVKPKENQQPKKPTPALIASDTNSSIQRRQSAGLPINWEKRLDSKTGRYYYLDHKTKSTYWQIPEDVVSGSVKRVPLKDEPKAPSSSSSLKRSHSTPNIAKALEEENQTPNIPSRNVKPSFHEYESPDVLNARLTSLNPVVGGAGKGLCGLRNLGNTCYMNSVLQCMFNTVHIIKYFINGLYKKDVNRENFLGSGGEITDGFAVLLQTVWSGNYSQITPRHFRQTIAKLNHIFESYQQQDSQELLLFLMDGLHEDLNEIKHREYVEDKDNERLPDKQAANIAWNKHKKLNKSIIVELFQGQFRACTSCLTCGTESRKFDIFMYLSLPLPSRSCSLMDAIAKFSEPEALTGDNKWNCPKCKVRRNAKRIIQIWKLPPVLFIHFKRFSFYQRYADKISTNVNFPHTNLDLSPAVKGHQPSKLYNLYAVSHHHGNTLDSGHYIATCKNAVNGNWYKFDDEAVSKTSAPSGPTAYMLCYTSFPHKIELQSK